MSNPRPWVIRKLQAEDGELSDLQLEPVGGNGLRIVRKARPDALVYCAGVEHGETFSLQDLEHALGVLSDAQFVVVVPTRIDHEVFVHAEELGVCVDGFGELVAALWEDEDVAGHLRREQAYVLRRLHQHRAVRSVRRYGPSAYEIERPKLSALTIVATDEYEITADHVYSLLESYANLALNAVVLTNPNARGISSDAKRAGEQAGVHVLLLNDFLGALHL
ncbi:MAG: hypothetical protein ACTHOE_04885 [Conexibacter sp.]